MLVGYRPVFTLQGNADDLLGPNKAKAFKEANDWAESVANREEMIILRIELQPVHAPHPDLGGLPCVHRPSRCNGGAYDGCACEAI